MHNSSTPPSGEAMTTRNGCLVSVYKDTENPNSRYAVPLVFEGAFSVSAINLVGVSV